MIEIEDFIYMDYNGFHFALFSMNREFYQIDSEKIRKIDDIHLTIFENFEKVMGDE